jgi:dihydroflavonol-4-reductase
MKTLVTGASGFIGSAVVRKLLSRGRAVRCFVEPSARLDNLDRLDVERVVGDVNDRATVERALDGCDVLFHLAAVYAIWVPDPSIFHRVNVEGTRTVLDAAQRAGIRRVVHTSSIAAVGRGRGGRPATEDDRFDARDWELGDEYVRSKWLSEEEALRRAGDGLPLVVVNPGFPFGARDLGPTPTGAFVLRALRHEVTACAAGGFSVIDVDDVAAGHLLAEERGRVGERYILASHNVTFRGFYDLVAEVADVPRPRLEVPRWILPKIAWVQERWADRVTRQAPVVTPKAARYAMDTHFFDNTKARRELGLPVTPLRESIVKSVRWFREHGYA